MKYRFFGKLMVLFIIIAGLLKFIQDLFLGNSAILTGIKTLLLVFALLSAVVSVSIMSWNTTNIHKKK